MSLFPQTKTVQTITNTSGSAPTIGNSEIRVTIPRQSRRLETVFLTQRPNRLNESILGEVTECVAFALTGERGLLKVVNTCDVPEDEVAALPNGAFVSVSARGAVLRGRVF